MQFCRKRNSRCLANINGKCVSIENCIWKTNNERESMIYLDNAATTKPKKEVVEAINECLVDIWGNPSSLHSFGKEAKEIIESCRATVAGFIKCSPREVIFTSGACEANSLAICGYLAANDAHVITSTIEHKSILNISKEHNEKCEIVGVDKLGFINIKQLENTMRNFPGSLVSIQFANNEIGTIQSMDVISDIVHKYKGVLHTDATQIIADRKVTVDKFDMLSFSGQKIGATKGVGVLYVRDGIKLKPIIYGAQENEMRGGTENVPYIAGLHEAIKGISYPSGDIRDYFVSRVISEIKDCYLVGGEIGNMRLKNNASICFKGVESESVLIMLEQKGIYVSSGSACNSQNLNPSHILKAIGVPGKDIYGVVRFSFRENTREEIDVVVEELKKIISVLRSFYD